MTRNLALAFLALPLAACASVPDVPIVEGTPLPAGTPVAIDQPVWVGDMVLTPKRVVEDSRCPMNTRCVWAGRLVVETRIDGAGWRETKELSLGETYVTHGQSVALVSAEPNTLAGQETSPAAYRFVYELR